MKKVIYSIFFASLFLFSSCGYESKQYKDLKVRTDSLVLEYQALQEDMREYANVLLHLSNSVSENTDSAWVNIDNVNTKLSQAENLKINATINRINSWISSSHEEVVNLKEQLARSAFRLNHLEKELARMTTQLNEEKSRVAELQYEVRQRNKKIDELNNKVLVLTSELQSAQTKISQQVSVIIKQENTINTGYYIIASTSELKKNKIYTKTGLFKHTLFEDEFKQSAFTKIDIRQVTRIELPLSAKGNILTFHPQAAYTITREGNKDVLNITNPERFWMISKYLVIE